MTTNADSRLSIEAPTYVTVAQLGHGWGVGRLWTPQSGDWWIEVLRADIDKFEDAADLRDAWNARGTHKR